MTSGQRISKKVYTVPVRQSFLNGSLTQLLDPDLTLKSKIIELVKSGDFGLASGRKSDGGYGQVWLREPIGAEEAASLPQTAELG